MKIKKQIKENRKYFHKKRILCIGDLILDDYQIGEVIGKSPEAPVPILSFLKNKVSNEKVIIMTDNIKINHFNIELDKINKKYKNDLNELHLKYFQEKKIKFMNIISIFKYYMLLHLNNLKNKDCNEYLLYNLLLEKKLQISITKFSIGKFFEIVNLVCKILSSKLYIVNYTNDIKI